MECTKDVVAANIRARMGYLGITAKEVATRSGLKEQTIGTYTRAENMPSSEKVYRLAEALECTPNDLMGWKEKEEA